MPKGSPAPEATDTSAEEDAATVLRGLDVGRPFPLVKEFHVLCPIMLDLRVIALLALSERLRSAIARLANQLGASTALPFGRACTCLL